MLSLATTIAIRAGAVIDGISIEKSLVFHQFGFCSNPQHCNANNQFILDEGEKVQSITYGRSSNTSYLNRPCKLSLQTNKRIRSSDRLAPTRRITQMLNFRQHQGEVFSQTLCRFKETEKDVDVENYSVAAALPTIWNWS